MKVLVACEFSGVVSAAFRKRGHQAFSCDLLPAEQASDWHIEGNVVDVVDAGWDLMVAQGEASRATGSVSLRADASRCADSMYRARESS
jgi:hypothetical protein